MPELKRSLGLFECTLMGVGVILGAGIYALVGKATLLAGNAVWISFAAASVVAALTGLSYAELSSFIPKAGGEYYYARRAFGEFVAFLVTWQLLVGLAIAAAAVALGFGGYFGALFETNSIWPAVGLVFGSSLLLIYGIRESAWIAGICTILEFLGLIVVIGVGLPQLGAIDYLETSDAGVSGVLSAAVLIFFAYIGFEEIVQLSEETRNPVRNIPRALLLSIVITTVLYVLVSLCAVSVLGWEKLGASESPLADVAAVALGSEAFVGLSIIALFSTANTVLILLMSSARLLYGMAEGGSLHHSLTAIHRTRKSPYLATIMVATIAVVMIVALEKIEIVANLTNFSLLATFVVINAAVIVLRFREPDAKRPFTVAGRIGRLPVIPVLGGVSSLMLLAGVGLTVIVIGVVIIVVGVVTYWISFHFRAKQLAP